MTAKNTGARWEITVDGKPRTYDRRTCGRCAGMTTVCTSPSRSRTVTFEAGLLSLRYSAASMASCLSKSRYFLGIARFTAGCLMDHYTR
jgi:hypothetical protein